MIYDLPTSVEICGVPHEIRSDFRAILDILVALSDPELDDRGKAEVALKIFYPGFEQISPEQYQEALEKCYWFINGGENDEGQKQPRQMDWEQDFPLIIAPVNRIVGKEIRSIPYNYEENTGGFHWWSFLGAYMEIGDCAFAQVVSIRNKLARHKNLEKHEKEWLRQNRKLVDFKRKYTEAEENLLQQWI